MRCVDTTPSTAELGIPDDAHTLRRAARAFDLYHSGKVEHEFTDAYRLTVTNHTFKVASQDVGLSPTITTYDRGKPYRVQIKQSRYLKAGCYAYCTCQDWMNYSGDQDLPDVNFWCKHSIAALVWLHNNNGRKRIANECGSAETKALQDKLNGQIDSQNNNGNGAKAPSQTMSLDIRDPFQEAEQLDVDQIERRGNGDLVHKLSNGEYVISYRGIMSLSQKHGIKFSDGFNSNTKSPTRRPGGQVIARARLNGNERVSGKLPIPSQETALELAKRNAARQLLPYAELKAVEKKAQLEATFDWQKAGCDALTRRLLLRSVWRWLAKQMSVS